VMLAACFVWTYFAFAHKGRTITRAQCSQSHGMVEPGQRLERMHETSSNNTSGTPLAVSTKSQTMSQTKDHEVTGRLSPDKHCLGQQAVHVVLIV
jgi:hypothetical protein